MNTRLGSASPPQSPAGGIASTAEVAPPPEPLLVGIDWADSEHVYAIRDPQGQIHFGTVQQSPKVISELLVSWRLQFGDRPIDVCLETSRGALINVLLQQQGVRVYPVNPNALANYRKAFAHGGGKNDPTDASLILQFLQHYRDQLRPLDLGTPLNSELDALCHQRRSLVELRVALAQQLIALLKAYFPALLATKPAKPYAEFLLKLLLKYPTLQHVQSAGRNKIRKLFYGLGSKKKIEERLDALFDAVPLSNDPVLLRSSTRHAQALVAQLLPLNQSIRGYEREITTLVRKHADYPFLKSLPCGAKSHARILAALGDDRQRFASAEQLATAAGIAPLTTQSGKSRFVSARWACSKFLRQTFHEFAGVTIKRSRWANAYYQSQLAKGKTSRMAKRALAYKWIRIIFRCWQNRVPYDEAHYIARLTASNSPLAKLLATN